MDYFKAKSGLISGKTRYAVVWRKAYSFYKNIASRSKRRPYIRSLYFKKEKVFLSIFWSHLKEKTQRDQRRRLKYYMVAIEVIRFSKLEPLKFTEKGTKDRYYRFYGIVDKSKKFVVQIKEDRSTGNKYLISIFPIK